MFRNSLNLGRMFGIRIRLNWSLIIIFLLVVVHLGAGAFPMWHPGWSAVMTWSVAVVAAIVFFLSILLHELSHSLTARAYKIPVRSITLFLFGGVSNIEEEPERPGKEAVIAIVGPLSSLAIGIFFLLLLGWAIPAGTTLPENDPTAFFAQLGPVETILAWAGPINILLAIFNMIPAFPLDGGRVLRAILWKASGDVVAGTRIAAVVSRVVAWGLVAVGVAMALGIEVPLFGAGLVGGIWLAVIGLFIGYAAKTSYQQMMIRQELTGVPVTQLMHAYDARIPVHMTLSQAALQFFMRHESDIFPVTENDAFVGWLSLDAMRRIPRETWESTRVADAMLDRADVFSIDIDEDAASALEQMQRTRNTQLVVLEQGQPRGRVALDDIGRWLEIHGRGRLRTA